jgi:hypothetical protein
MIDDDAVEYYKDAISGTVRRYRGRRKRVKRGPYSLEEKNMIAAFDDLLASQRRMDGELAQYTCRDITVLLTRLRIECERYSYENTGRDISDVDPHVVIESIDMEIVDAPDDTDIWEGMQ